MNNFERIFLVFIFMAFSLFSQEADSKAQKEVSELQKPLFHPFVENYILNEIKTLRDENRNLKIELHETLTQKELSITGKAVDYATATIGNMFYIIAAASSILVLLGWNSLRDMNERIRTTVDDRINRLFKENEQRMQSFEDDLAERSYQVLRNQEEIAKTNAIHSLWMRAGLEQTPSGKIEIYDQILKIRPQDAEAICYKADAALELGEINWSLSLSNQSLNIDPNYPNAYFQRACAYAALGYEDNAIDDLEKALELNENYLEEIQNDRDFEVLKENERFTGLIERYSPNVVE